jgi:hypothetical protein
MISKTPARAARNAPAATRRREQQALSPGWSARVLARLRSHSLDRALSDGADPVTSRQLAARAAQLTARPTREELARCLEQLVERAHASERRRAVQLNRAAILVNAHAMREMAAQLSGPAPVYARGVAALHELLTDGTGPVFVRDSEPPALEHALGRARAALCDYAAD